MLQMDDPLSELSATRQRVPDLHSGISYRDAPGMTVRMAVGNVQWDAAVTITQKHPPSILGAKLSMKYASQPVWSSRMLRSTQ